jgi:hypothetical protein
LIKPDKLATLLSAVVSEPSASEMCSNCKVKAVSGGASEVPPQALSTKAVVMDASHAFLKKNCFMFIFLRLLKQPKLIANCVSAKKISCKKYEIKL